MKNMKLNFVVMSAIAVAFSAFSAPLVMASGQDREVMSSLPELKKLIETESAAFPFLTQLKLEAEEKNAKADVEKYCNGVLKYAGGSPSLLASEISALAWADFSFLGDVMGSSAELRAKILDVALKGGKLSKDDFKGDYTESSKAWNAYRDLVAKNRVNGCELAEAQLAMVNAMKKKQQKAVEQFKREHRVGTSFSFVSGRKVKKFDVDSDMSRRSKKMTKAEMIQLLDGS